MRNHSLCVLMIAVVLLSSTFTPSAFCHSDDPKVLDRQPPFFAPAYRAGDPQSALLTTFNSQGINLKSWLPLNVFGSQMTSGNDCWGYVSPSGREYALIGLSHGTGVVEVTNPANAQLITVIAGPSSLWRDIKVYQNYAYAVSEGGDGIQVISLSQIDNGIVTLVRTVTTGGTTATHNVAINTATGYLYRTGGGNGGLRIYNLANPSNPAYVGSWNDRYVHDAQIVSYTSGPYAGKEIAFCCSGYNGGSGQTGLDILDVTNKSNIINLSRIQYQNNRYSHQGWLTADRHYFFLGDELDEDGSYPSTTVIIDVSNLSSPVEVGRYTNNNVAITHNLYTLNNYVFAANYRSGLRVFDATNPLAPTETAWFDTYPGNDSANFNGLWSVYPYLPSGTIIGSDMERGLFVWRMGNPPLDIAFPAGVPETVAPAGAPVRVRVTAEGNETLDPSSVQLMVSTGGSFSPIPMTDDGDGFFVAQFPATQCGSQLTYYVIAETTQGTFVKSPDTAPVSAYTALASYGVDIEVDDAMESDAGWTVGAPGDDAVRGVWERSIPEATNAQPGADHSTGGSFCWVTDGRAGETDNDFDVDGGITTLTSPAYDVSQLAGPTVSYWRWYSNSVGSNPNTDWMLVQISNNNGTSWTNLETVGPKGEDVAGGWFYSEFRVADYVAPSTAVRLRFIASDTGFTGVVEAAIDDLRVTGSVCTPPACQGDLDGNSHVDAQDLALLLSSFGANSGGDLNGDDETDSQDLALLLANWEVSCN